MWEGEEEFEEDEEGKEEKAFFSFFKVFHDIWLLGICLEFSSQSILYLSLFAFLKY